MNENVYMIRRFCRQVVDRPYYLVIKLFSLLFSDKIIFVENSIGDSIINLQLRIKQTKANQTLKNKYLGLDKYWKFRNLTKRQND